MRTHWRFSTASDILFGQNTARQLGRELALLSISSAFIVTDANLLKAGVAEVVVSGLKDAGLDAVVFDGCRPEPSTDVVMAAVAAARAARQGAFGCVIGLGGGSNMDTAKAAAVVLQHGGEAWDYFGENVVPGPVVPVVAVPTTSGTGSETTPIAVIEDTRKGLKLAVVSPHILPRLSVVDPLLTLSCPPRVTAESGMDALTHAIESYTTLDHGALPVPADQRVSFPGRNPLSQTLSARAIQLIGENLRAAVYQPHNVAAREAMSLGALMAGLAFANSGLSSVHALQYPVGAITHTSHGLGNAILLPSVMEYLVPAATAELAQIAVWLGESTAGLSPRDAAMKAVSAVQQLKADIGIPRGLGDIGIKPEHVPDMAKTGATYARLIRCSPRPVGVEALESILRKAL